MTGGLQIEYAVPNTINEKKLTEIKEDILKNYLYESRPVITDLLIYTVNTNALRMDIGLNVESDVQKAQKRTEDIRRMLPAFFKKYDVTVSESIFVSV